jgi:hypothetical protein
MKKQTLERFIRDNRDDFDAAEPARDLWARLEAQLPADAGVPAPPPVVPLWKRPLWRAAASVLLIFGLGLLGYRYLSTPASTDPVLARVDPESARMAVQYASLIGSKRLELRELEQEDAELYQSFVTEGERLDQDYQKLRQELRRTPNQEELAGALIQNLEMQLNLLNRQLRVIETIKKAKKRHENDPVV